MANAQPCFATHFLDGFDLLYKRTDEVLKSTSEISKFFKKFSDAEAAYAKSILGLASLSKSKKLFKRDTSLATDKEIGTLKEAWENIHNDLESIGNKHQTLSNSLASELSNSIANFVKDNENERKRLVNEGMKMTKEYKETMDTLQRTKTVYYSRCKDADTAQAAHEKAKAEGSMKPKEVNKLASRAVKCHEIAKNAHEEYQNYLRKANSKQSKFYELEMPKLLADFEKFERDRILFLKASFEKLSTYMAELPDFLRTVADSFVKSAGDISVDRDILEFVEKNQTAVSKPAAINYEPYTSDNPNFGGMYINNSASGNVAAKGAAQATPAAPQPAAGSPAKDFGLKAADISLSNDDKLKKLQEQLQELNATLQAETKSVDGLEKLVQFYASDPVAQDKAKGELEDQKKKISTLKETRARLRQQVAELGGAVDTADDDHVGDAEAAVAAPVAAAVRVRALYDYAGANQNELSFQEGDIIVVSEMDESGWWFAELSGRTGFIPQNYVEMLS